MRFVLFGDSISFGQGVSLHRTWATRCAAMLDEQFGRNHAIEFINTSINGNTTRMALERMPHDVQAHRPDVLVVQFGLNDANHWVSDNGHPRVSPSAFEANLLEIGARARASGCRVLAYLTNHVPDPTGPLQAKQSPLASAPYSKRVMDYNATIRKVSMTIAAELVDIAEAWPHDAYDSLLLADGLHLSLAGHDTMYDIVQSAFTTLARLATEA